MRINLRTTILTGLAALGMAVVLPAIASAALTGVCSACHTMHNSQGGTNVVGTLTNPNDNLLKDNCIGCHTGGANDGTSTPQVDDSANPLAGGFFAAAADDGKGHDVTGVNGSDATLGNNPPGGTIGGALSCDGANGCHSAKGVHHTNTTGSWVTTGYRFLTGTVAGRESTDWEFNTAATSHNVYAGVAGGAGTVNALCNACHDKFHGTAADESGTGSGAWIRHPTDIDVFAAGGEYDSYGAGSSGVGVYSVVAPVGTSRALGAGYDDQNLTNGDGFVLCVSCHRAHGSGEADMLRWSYSTISAGGGGFSGCFICHTEKN